jgi:hypothetical protein
MKRRITIFALSAALALAPLTAMAADGQSAPTQADLTPGAAAGVQNAQMMEGNTFLYVAAGVAVIAIVAVAASNGGGGGSTSTTTSTSP